MGRSRPGLKGRTVAIVQARMGSSRFPRKMVSRLGDYSLLEWVLRRTSQAPELDQVILATSDRSDDDVLVDVAEQCGVAAFRGDEADVLQRFVGAARASQAELIVRVCADSPFIDPQEIGRLVDFFANTACHYACNHQDRLGSRYADGFGAEILSATLLEHVAAIATEPEHREHVTQFLWDHPEAYDLRAVAAPAALAQPDLRFDVDTPSDLFQLSALVAAGVGLETPASRIVEISAPRRLSLD